MNAPVAILVLLIFVAVVSVLFRLARSSAKQSSVFQKHDSLFTAAERSFIGVLDLAAGSRYRVFGKARVADVIRPAKGLHKSLSTSLFNQIRAKHFDFVLCDPKTLDIRAVIELNDSSHQSKRRATRDDFLQKACKDAELPLLMIPAKRSYSVEFVRDELAKLQIVSDNFGTLNLPGRIEPSL